MNKAKAIKIILLSAAALLAVLFVTFLFLSLPLGGRASVLPMTAFYVVGWVSAGLFLLSTVLFFLRSRKVG